MHYQIFLPDKRGQNPQLLVEAGLADHVEGAQWVECSEGPTGGPGAMVFWQPKGEQPRFGFVPDEQEWIPAAPQPGTGERGRYWVGVWRQSPPGPRDLQRPAALPGLQVAHSGYWVRLGDGNRWVVAAAAMLPRDFRIDPETGQVREELQEDYRSFWRKSQELYRLVLGEGRIDLPWADWWDYLVQALRFNYRLTPEVVSHLRLLNSETAPLVALATIQQPEIQQVEDELEKKGEASTPGT